MSKILPAVTRLPINVNEHIKNGSVVTKVMPLDTSKPGNVYDAHTALTMGQLADLVYDSPVDVKAKLAKSGNELTAFYSNDGTGSSDLIKQDAQAFVASTKDAVFVSFRGTESVDDAIADAKAIGAERFTFQDGGYAMVHEGFKEAVDSLDGLGVKKFSDNPSTLSMTEEVKRLMQGPPARKLYVTGHSLGGAMATLFSMKMADQGMKPEAMYTIGSPRVGMQSFMARFDALLEDRAFRMVNYSDTVTRAPMDKHWLNFMNAMSPTIQDKYFPDFINKGDTKFGWTQYRHVGTPIYFGGDGMLTSEPEFWSKAGDWALNVADGILGSGQDLLAKTGLVAPTTGPTLGTATLHHLTKNYLAVLEQNLPENAGKPVKYSSIGMATNGYAFAKKGYFRVVEDVSLSIEAAANARDEVVESVQKRLAALKKLNPDSRGAFVPNAGRSTGISADDKGGDN
jgi:hypothetical protein